MGGKNDKPSSLHDCPFIADKRNFIDNKFSRIGNNTRNTFNSRNILCVQTKITIVYTAFLQYEAQNSDNSPKLYHRNNESKNQTKQYKKC